MSPFWIGTMIDDTEYFKISQNADDTEVIQDGS